MLRARGVQDAAAARRELRGVGRHGHGLLLEASLAHRGGGLVTLLRSAAQLLEHRVELGGELGADGVDAVGHLRVHLLELPVVAQPRILLLPAQRGHRVLEHREAAAPLVVHRALLLQLEDALLVGEGRAHEHVQPLALLAEQEGEEARVFDHELRAHARVLRLLLLRHHVVAVAEDCDEEVEQHDRDEEGEGVEQQSEHHRHGRHLRVHGVRAHIERAEHHAEEGERRVLGDGLRREHVKGHGEADDDQQHDEHEGADVVDRLQDGAHERSVGAHVEEHFEAHQHDQHRENASTRLVLRHDVGQPGDEDERVVEKVRPVERGEEVVAHRIAFKESECLEHYEGRREDHHHGGGNHLGHHGVRYDHHEHAAVCAEEHAVHAPHAVAPEGLHDGHGEGVVVEPGARRASVEPLEDDEQVRKVATEGHYAAGVVGALPLAVALTEEDAVHRLQWPFAVRLVDEARPRSGRFCGPETLHPVFGAFESSARGEGVGSGLVRKRHVHRLAAHHVDSAAARGLVRECEGGQQRRKQFWVSLPDGDELLHEALARHGARKGGGVHRVVLHEVREPFQQHADAVFGVCSQSDVEHRRHDGHLCLRVPAGPRRSGGRRRAQAQRVVLAAHHVREGEGQRVDEDEGRDVQQHLNRV
mmetsp:Transcript_35767/g.89220  ORF Transcript_35767/g.89220 Transcript_35767/m.89220 type:complete len:646 (-) Transcript_35767:737-2674(-)